MRLLEASAFVQLRDAGLQLQRESKEVKLAIDLAKDIFAEAAEREQPFIYHTPETWARKWLPSKRFRLVRLPLNAAAMPCEPKVENLVLKKIHAMETKPVVVDYNRNQVGKSMHGFVPQIIVIDGKHRWKAAALRGDTHIMAWVGEIAAQEMKALGSGGGGPAPERTTPAGGASLISQGSSKQEARLANRTGTYAEGLVKYPTFKNEADKLKTLNVEDVKSYGTSEGSSKGWDTRGRGQNTHAKALKEAGFTYRGKDSGLHRYSAVTQNPGYDKDEGGFGKNLHHNVWVDPSNGHWAHESSYNRTSMAHGRKDGKDAKSLGNYLGSESHEFSRALSRNGSVWNRL